LKPLDVEGLVRVLREPKNALMKQYQKLFQMEQAELEFTEDAVRCIAKKAMEKGTGARGLRSIIEGVMLDIMYDLPERGQGSRYVITPEVVNGQVPMFAVSEKKSA